MVQIGNVMRLWKDKTYIQQGAITGVIIAVLSAVAIFVISFGTINAFRSIYLLVNGFIIFWFEVKDLSLLYTLALFVYWPLIGVSSGFMYSKLHKKRLLLYSLTTVLLLFFLAVNILFGAVWVNSQGNNFGH